MNPKQKQDVLLEYYSDILPLTALLASSIMMVATPFKDHDNKMDRNLMHCGTLNTKKIHSGTSMAEEDILFKRLEMVNG